jgi:hypothetical protein
LKGASLFAVNLAPVSNTQQVKNAFRTVKVVDDAIFANAQSKSLDSLHAVVRVDVESHAQAVNRGFDSGLDGSGQIEEVGIEIA